MTCLPVCWTRGVTGWSCGESVCAASGRCLARGQHLRAGPAHAFLACEYTGIVEDALCALHGALTIVTYQTQCRLRSSAHTILTFFFCTFLPTGLPV